MNTMTCTGESALGAKPIRARWYAVRSRLKWTLALSAGTWIALLAHEATRGLVLDQQLGAAAGFAAQHAMLALNLVASFAVGAVVAEGLRTSKLQRAIRRLRRKFGRIFPLQSRAQSPG